MNTRPLLIGPDEKARAAAIMAHAEANPYTPGAGAATPGDNKAFVGEFNTYRTVFTYTHLKGDVFRHLSVSVPGGHYPNPFAVWLLAETFGFTGWDGVSGEVPKNWQVHLKEDEHCVVVVQKMTQ